MSWSLQISHGDFSVSQSQYGVVTDTSKLVQDLRCALLEKMGTDDMHPYYGSLINGGTMPDGTVTAGVIGLLDWQQVTNTVNAEIERIASTYQAQQLNRAKDDRQTYNRVTLSPAEVLIAISNIKFLQVQDTLQVSIEIQTAAGQTISAVFPLNN